jgi:hypothetical protein
MSWLKNLAIAIGGAAAGAAANASATAVQKENLAKIGLPTNLPSELPGPWIGQVAQVLMYATRDWNLTGAISIAAGFSGKEFVMRKNRRFLLLSAGLVFGLALVLLTQLTAVESIGYRRKPTLPTITTLPPFPERFPAMPLPPLRKRRTT